MATERETHPDGSGSRDDIGCSQIGPKTGPSPPKRKPYVWAAAVLISQSTLISLMLGVPVASVGHIDSRHWGMGPNQRFAKENDNPDPPPDRRGGGGTKTKSKTSFNTAGYKGQLGLEPPTPDDSFTIEQPCEPSWSAVLVQRPLGC